MKHNWKKLDNAAKIFPAAANKTDTQVFRFSCELYEEIDPAILEKALSASIQEFKVFQCTMKRGIFWYYLEETDMLPAVSEEYKPLCSRLYRKNKPGLLFEVTYYKCRINFEVHHVLTDGTGALRFLQNIVSKYLSISHDLHEPPLGYDASQYQMNDDSFSKYYSDDKPAKASKKVKAAKLRGSRLSNEQLGVITGHVSVRDVLSASHKHNATLTEFLSACLIKAIGETFTLRERKKPIVLAIPVNLRKYFPSESARNFFSVQYMDCAYSNHTDFEQILSKIKADFSSKLTKENLSANMNKFFSIETNYAIKIAPLFFKDIVLKIAYDLSMKESTAGLSNIGTANMPPVLMPFIRSFDICASTNKLQLCICSAGDVLSLSFTSPFASTEIQRCFFRILTEFGINAEISTNLADDRLQ